MIIGDCPYCGGLVSTAFIRPGFNLETCPHCQKDYRLKHSVVDPVAYTLGSWAELFDLDPITKIATEKYPNSSR